MEAVATASIHSLVFKNSSGMCSARCCFVGVGRMATSPSFASLVAVFATLTLVPVLGAGDVLKDFQEWFVSRGGSAPSLDLAPFPGMGTGVRATAAVQEGDAVITAPLSMIMYDGKARSCCGDGSCWTCVSNAHGAQPGPDV